MTLGISSAVSSSTDAFMTAICCSRRKSAAHRIESSLLLSVDPKHLPQPHLQRCFSGDLAASVQPVFKILNFDDMRDLGMPDFDSDGGQSSSDVADPVMTAQRGKGLGNGFVEGLGCHVERMRGLVQ